MVYTPQEGCLLVRGARVPHCHPIWIVRGRDQVPPFNANREGQTWPRTKPMMNLLCRVGIQQLPQQSFPTSWVKGRMRDWCQEFVDTWWGLTGCWMRSLHNANALNNAREECVSSPHQGVTDKRLRVWSDHKGGMGAKRCYRASEGGQPSRRWVGSVPVNSTLVPIEADSSRFFKDDEEARCS